MRLDLPGKTVAITGAGVGFASLMLRVNVTTNGVTTTIAQDATTLTQALGGAARSQRHPTSVRDRSTNA